jgi:outer membrane murein-binding lipoprotein Lpp
MSITRSGSLTCAAAAIVVTALVAGCSSPTSQRNRGSTDATTRSEQRAVDALNLKNRYKDVVMGTDVKGSTLVLYVDVNNLYSMDESSEDALKSQTLTHWKRIWVAAHPNKHVKLRLSVCDYYGNEVTAQDVKV